MLGIFSSKKNHFVGIDYGTAAIKLIDLSYIKGRVHLENYGWVKTGMISSNGKGGQLLQLSFDEKIKSYMQELVRRISPKSKAAFISIPSYKGLITMAEFPKMKKSEMDQAIQFEAKKYIPMSLEDVSIGWDIIADDGKASDKVKVALVAVPKKEVAKYEKITLDAGLEVGSIELEAFSLSRSLIGDDPGTFIIVDIGARATNLILVERGIVRVNRSIDIGGYDITVAVAENMNVSKQRAENLKKEREDLIYGSRLSLVIPPLELIATEINRMIEVASNKNGKIRIDSVILSGGSAKIKKLDQYLSEELKIKTVLGNPWRKIVIDNDLNQFVQEKLGTSFSVAIGLALLGVEKYKRS